MQEADSGTPAAAPASGAAEGIRVVIADELGLGAELEEDMERHVRSYECEWAATLASPERVARFTSFVNTDIADPSIARVTVRGQRIPAPPIGATR